MRKLLLLFVLLSSCAAHHTANTPTQKTTTSYFICGAGTRPFFLEQIEFDINQSRLGPEDTQILDKVVVFLRENPSIKLRVDGYASTEERNPRHLSSRRASAAVAYLLSEKIPQERLTTVSYHPDNTSTGGPSLGRYARFMVEYQIE